MNDKMDFLIRRNKGRALLDDYVEAISAILGYSADTIRNDLLPLEHSDDIIKEYYRKINSISNNTYDDFYCCLEIKDKKINKDDILDVLKYEILDEVYLITSKSEFCGVLRIKFKEIIDKINDIIDYDGEEFGAVSKNKEIGLSVDISIADENNIYTITSYNSA